MTYELTLLAEALAQLERLEPAKNVNGHFQNCDRCQQPTQNHDVRCSYAATRRLIRQITERLRQSRRDEKRQPGVIGRQSA